MQCMKLFCPTFNERTFTLVHRIGYKQKDITRPIIARFHHLKDKMALQQHYSELSKQYGMSVTDDYPYEIETERKQLLPVLQTAKQLSSDYNARLVANKLFINGKRYSTESLSQLPPALHPERIFTPSRDGMTAFFTKNSPLSNHFPSDFKVNGDKYSSMEQYIMSVKAESFGDHELHAKIMAENNPVKLRRMARFVNNFSNNKWKSVAEEKVPEGLLAKFIQNQHLGQFLINTKEDLLLEASRDRFWGIGKTLKDKDLWHQGQWTGYNFMGKLLMKTRKQLKDIKE